MRSTMSAVVLTLASALVTQAAPQFAGQHQQSVIVHPPGVVESVRPASGTISQVIIYPPPGTICGPGGCFTAWGRANADMHTPRSYRPSEAPPIDARYQTPLQYRRSTQPNRIVDFQLGLQLCPGCRQR